MDVPAARRAAAARRLVLWHSVRSAHNTCTLVSGAILESSYAQARPAEPAPMMTTSLSGYHMCGCLARVGEDAGRARSTDNPSRRRNYPVPVANGMFSAQTPPHIAVRGAGTRGDPAPSVASNAGARARARAGRAARQAGTGWRRLGQAGQRGARKHAGSPWAHQRTCPGRRSSGWSWRGTPARDGARGAGWGGAIAGRACECWGEPGRAAAARAARTCASLMGANLKPSKGVVVVGKE